MGLTTWEVADRYATYDERQRTREAERAAAEELDDLRALTALERRRQEGHDGG